MPRLPVAPSPSVADLASDGEVLLVEFDGAAGLAEVRVGVAEVACGVSLSSAVADLASDGEVLLVEFDGAAGLAEGRVGDAEAACGVSLSSAVADLASDGEVLLVEFDGAAGLAEGRVGVAEVACQRISFSTLVIQKPSRFESRLQASGSAPEARGAVAGRRCRQPDSLP